MLTTFPILLLALTQRCAQVAATPLHDQRQQQQRQQPFLPLDHSQGYQFDPLLHLPGTSPYFDAVGFGLQHDAPLGCNVTAASYLIRHGAIYANDDEYDKFIKPFLWKVEQNRGHWRGQLTFLNTWTSPILEDSLEELTPSGRRDAANVGLHLVKRYPHLVNSTKRIMSDTKSRTVDTAKAFVEHFHNAPDIELVKVSKPKDGSIEAIIPHKTCKAFSKDPGDAEFAVFVTHYTASVQKRLAPSMPAHNTSLLTPFDIVGMQSLCGYESAIRDHRSPFCIAFTDDEWMSYEYAWDMKYAHMVGPLNKLSPYLGMPWLDAQTTIFDSVSANASTPGDGWPDGQRFFLYFTHREVPPFVATVLGIFNSTFEMQNQFPTDRVVWTRAWKMSDLIPFLGHVGLEKMTCDRPGAEGEYVRVIANTAARPMPGCQSGPGASCPFQAFKDIVGDGVTQYGDAESVCAKSKSKSEAETEAGSGLRAETEHMDEIEL